MTGHNADFAFFGGNDAWAVGADQAAVGARKRAFHPHHVQNGDALGDADDQFNAGVNGFANRISRKGRGDINHRGIAIGGGPRIAHGVKNGQVQMLSAALAWGDAAHHFGAVSNGLFRVKGPLRPRKALTDDPRVFVDQNSHDMNPML